MPGHGSGPSTLRWQHVGTRKYSHWEFKVQNIRVHFLEGMSCLFVIVPDQYLCCIFKLFLNFFVNVSPSKWYYHIYHCFLRAYCSLGLSIFVTFWKLFCLFVSKQKFCISHCTDLLRVLVLFCMSFRLLLEMDCQSQFVNRACACLTNFSCFAKCAGKLTVN